MLSTRRLIEESLISFISYGLDIVEAYDPVLKEKRAHRQAKDKMLPITSEKDSEWAEAKEDVQELGLRHL
jgi:hypothetical protein